MISFQKWPNMKICYSKYQCYWILCNILVSVEESTEFNSIDTLKTYFYSVFSILSHFYIITTFDKMHLYLTILDIWTIENCNNWQICWILSCVEFIYLLLLVVVSWLTGTDISSVQFQIVWWYAYACRCTKCISGKPTTKLLI